MYEIVELASATTTLHQEKEKPAKGGDEREEKTFPLVSGLAFALDYVRERSCCFLCLTKSETSLRFTCNKYPQALGMVVLQKLSEDKSCSFIPARYAAIPKI